VGDIDHQRHTSMNPTTHIMATRDDWCIEAEWTDPASGETRLFRSDRLDHWDAERYPAGSPITVLIDPQNPDSTTSRLPASAQHRNAAPYSLSL
jgi:hypothetical protein